MKLKEAETQNLSAFSQQNSSSLVGEGKNGRGAFSKPGLHQENSTTRKARLSPFLSLYFWHELIRLEPRKIRGGGLKFRQSLVMAPD